MTDTPPRRPGVTGAFRGAPPSPGLAMLGELMNNHLDAGYAAAAQRRDTEQPPGTAVRRVRSASVALTLVVVGVILAVAYQQAVAKAPDAAQAKASLVEDIKRRSAAAEALQRDADNLRERLARDRKAALADSAAGQQTAEVLQRLETVAGLNSVSGQGIVVTVGDGPPPEDPVTGEPTNELDLGKVYDRDLQELVNVLWRAGAEAIAIDGQRLTPTSTIRLAGEAILVDLRPVSSPYEIKAIGDADTLNDRFTGSSVARRFRDYIQRHQMTFKVNRTGKLTLPASAGTVLAYAHEPGSNASRTAPRSSASPSASAGSPSAPAPTPTGGGR